MLQFEIVGYATKTARDWWTSMPFDRDMNLAVARSIAPTAKFERMGRVADVPLRHPLLGVAGFDSVIIVAWSGIPSSAFRWDRLQAGNRNNRFHIGCFPASDGMEASWIQDGQVMRHVLISNSQVVKNVGSGRVFDENADEDRSIYVQLGQRLPQKRLETMFSQAAEDDQHVYQGRRFVRCDDEETISSARILRKHEGSWWIAVDQKGRVNTLIDRLAVLNDGGADLDVDRLALRVTKEWFRVRMDDKHDMPMCLYSI